jgi:hypothetical protein
MKKLAASLIALATLGGGYLAVDWLKDENYRRDCIVHTNDGPQCLRGPAGWASQRCWGVDAKGRPVGRQLPPGFTGNGVGECVRAWLAHGK